MKKIIVAVLGAIIGVAAAITIHCSFFITEAETGVMLPTIEPGQKVLVFLLADRKEIKAGDIVAYKPPYYTIDGEQKAAIRRVVSTSENDLVVSCDANVTDDEKTIIMREDILGKAIWF